MSQDLTGLTFPGPLSRSGWGTTCLSSARVLPQPEKVRILVDPVWVRVLSRVDSGYLEVGRR